MKNKLIFLFLLVANFAFAQLSCNVTAVSSVGSTDKFMLCVGGNSRHATLFKIIDTTKVPYFPSVRSTGLVKFDGVRWVADAGKFIPYTSLDTSFSNNSFFNNNKNEWRIGRTYGDFGKLYLRFSHNPGDDYTTELLAQDSTDSDYNSGVRAVTDGTNAGTYSEIHANGTGNDTYVRTKADGSVTIGTNGYVITTPSSAPGDSTVILHTTGGNYVFAPYNSGGGSTLSVASVSEINTGTDNAKYTTALGIEGSKYLNQSGSKIHAATSGTSTYTATLSPAITAYNQGLALRLKIGSASTAASTLNVNGVGAKKWYRDPSTQIVSGDLNTGYIYNSIYDTGLDGGSGGWLVTDALAMIGATSVVAGRGGNVPAPVAGEQDYVLAGSGIWRTVNNVLGLPAYVRLAKYVNSELTLNNTGTTTNNILRSTLFTGGLPQQSTLSVSGFFLTTAGSSSCTIRWYVNTTNSLTGAILLGTYTAGGASETQFGRTIWVGSDLSNTTNRVNSVAVGTSSSFGGVPRTSFSINLSSTFYFIVACQNPLTTDNATVLDYKVTVILN